MSANLVINGTTYSGVNSVKIPNTSSQLEEFIQPSGKKEITANGDNIDVKAYDKVKVAVPSTTPSGTISITANGTYDVTDKASAEVNVSGGSATLQTKSVTPTASQQVVAPDNGYDGLSSVTVSAAPIQSSKTVTPGASQQTVQPDSGYLGLAQVIVEAASAAGLPIYTGTHTVNNRNTQHVINHNLNLDSYIGIYWLDDMASYMEDTSKTDTSIMFGMAGYKVDLGLSSENGLATGIGFVKAYKSSTAAWKGNGDSTNASTKDALEMNYLYGAAEGTYNYVIIDLSNLSRGAST